MTGCMADGGEGRCVLSSVPRLGQWLGVAIVVTGSIAFCMFLVIGFVVVMSVVIVGSVCGVTDFIGTVVAVMVVFWVVGGAIIVVLFAFVVGFIVVGFGSDMNGMVAVVVRCNGCSCVFSFDSTWKTGSGQKHKGQFVV